MPSLAELLFERSRMSSWVIVSKSLVTFHNLMSAGNEVRYILILLKFVTFLLFSCVKVKLNIEIIRVNLIA